MPLASARARRANRRGPAGARAGPLAPGWVGPRFVVVLTLQRVEQARQGAWRRSSRLQRGKSFSHGSERRSVLLGVLATWSGSTALRTVVDLTQHPIVASLARQTPRQNWWSVYVAARCCSALQSSIYFSPFPLALLLQLERVGATFPGPAPHNRPFDDRCADISLCAPAADHVL